MNPLQDYSTAGLINELARRLAEECIENGMGADSDVREAVEMAYGDMLVDATTQQLEALDAE